MKNPEAAEEVVQDTFITFYNKRNEVEDNPLAYLNSILRFKILDYIKTQKSFAIIDIDIAPALKATENTALEKLDTLEAKQRIYNHIQQLPEQCRNVFVLRKEFNLSNSEVAEKLGISVKAVEAHMTRAMKQLSHELGLPLLVLVAMSTL